MNYAIVENRTVVNIIVGPLPEGMNGIPVEDRQVAIGDHYSNGVFTQNGEIIMTDAERISALQARIAELEAQT